MNFVKDSKIHSIILKNTEEIALVPNLQVAQPKCLYHDGISKYMCSFSN